MHKLFIKIIKPALPVFLFAFVSITANAQKLPTVQAGSLRAPANLKIDGKATEWNNKFQAYNHHTDFYYTMANNDNNLYVIIQAVTPDAIRRILNGGISLTINKSGKKDDKNGMAITYPVINRDNKFGVSFKNMPVIVPGSVATVMKADSFMNATNKSMASKSKLIRVDGIKDLDTLISVYNVDGIKAAALFDNTLVYTYELSVSLKQLGLSVNNPVKFAYQLMVDEVLPRNNDESPLMPNRLARPAAPAKRPDPGQFATYFWGEYVLAK